MRIVAGKHRGRVLTVPAGRDVRPTGDRVRESLFNLLAHGNYGADGVSVFENAHVLDAFAGSGALGLEALSRGAAECVFMETAKPALDAIEENAAALGDAAQVRLIRADATRPPRAPSSMDLVFLDPPYRKDLLPPALAGLSSMGWIDAETLCCAELDGHDEFDPPSEMAILADRRYGRTRIVLLRAAG